MAAPTPSLPTNTGDGMIIIDGPTLLSLIPPTVLIPHLRSALPALSSSIISPPRLSFPISPPPPSSLLLIMPSWCLSQSLPYIGTKLLTSFPFNSPSIHASYSLFSSLSGRPLASLDADLLTLLRTSSLSALSSLLLSSPSPSTLLLAGAGSLGPHLILAHRAALPSLSRFIIWNRSPHKSKTLASHLQQQQGGIGGQGVCFEHAEDLDEVIGQADIIICATGAQSPIVKGRMIKDGAHLSLMGSFTKDMRECDDDAIKRGRVFVDVEEAVETAGEITGAIERGVIGREDVVGTLVDLAAGKVVGRRAEDEVTVFKSVGSAVFDLLAAGLVYESYMKGQGHNQPSI